MSDLTPLASSAPGNTDYVTGSWARHVTQPLAIGVINTAIFVCVAGVIDLVVPQPGWVAATPVYFVISLQAVFSTLWLRRPGQRLVGRTPYRLAEFATIAILLRLVAWLMADGGPPTLELVRLYLREPLSFFTDGVYIGLLIIAFLVWTSAIRFATLFARLAVTETEVRYYLQPAAERSGWVDDKPIEINRQRLVTEFFRQWLWGGVVLALCAGLSTLDLGGMAAVSNPLALARLGLQPAVLAALISYFLVGLWLLSQGRLQVMNARWLINGFQKQGSIEARWRRGSLLLLLVVAVAAAFVPIGSTLPISRLLNLVLGTLLYVLTYAFYLISLLIGLLLSLLSRSPDQSTAESPAEPPPSWQDALQQQEPQPPGTPDPTLTLLFSSLFWTLIIALAAVAVLYFLRERGYSLGRASWGPRWAAFKQWLRWLWRGATRQVQAARTGVRQALRRSPPEVELPRPPWRFVRVNALPPTEQVRYFYLSVVRRAGEQGVARRESATPLEYVRQLQQNWPEREEEIEQLTEAFVQARYAPREIPREQASAVKSTWKRVRSALRRRKTHPSAAAGTPESGDASGFE